MTGSEEHQSAGPAPTVAAAGGLDDPRLAQVVEDYRKELLAGPRPDRHAFLARHPELAPALAECLDALDFLHGAAGQLPPAEAASPSADEGSSALLCPEGALGEDCGATGTWFRTRDDSSTSSASCRSSRTSRRRVPW